MEKRKQKERRLTVDQIVGAWALRDQGKEASYSGIDSCCSSKTKWLLQIFFFPLRFPRKLPRKLRRERERERIESSNSCKAVTNDIICVMAAALCYFQIKIFSFFSFFPNKESLLLLPIKKNIQNLTSKWCVQAKTQPSNTVRISK